MLWKGFHHNIWTKKVSASGGKAPRPPPGRTPSFFCDLWQFTLALRKNIISCFLGYISLIPTLNPAGFISLGSTSHVPISSTTSGWSVIYKSHFPLEDSKGNKMVTCGCSTVRNSPTLETCKRFIKKSPWNFIIIVTCDFYVYNE